MKIAIVGARGMPLPGRSFGGFETFIGGLAPRLVTRGHDVTVYARRKLYPNHPDEYQGVRLRWLPAIEGKVLGTPTHTLLAMLDALRRRFDAMLVVNPGNGLQCIIPRLFTRTRVVMNVDGVEWRRGKWGWVGRSYFRAAAWMSTKLCQAIVADSQAIADLYERDFGIRPAFVPYAFEPRDPGSSARIRELGLEPKGYYLVVARLIPENNTVPIVEEFTSAAVSRPLVVVGGANYRSRYHERLAGLESERVRFVGHVDDMDLLWNLYGHAYAYVHGHSVGGTNPALLQAMASGICPIVYDVAFNREVAGDAAIVFTGETGSLRSILERLDRDSDRVSALGRDARRRLVERYSWERVVGGYERILTCIKFITQF